VKWRKLGVIFDPRRYTLPNGCTSFAQSPQALAADGFVRIYFSTRTRDAAGQYLSHIAYVDVDNDLRGVLRVATDTVIPLGDPGCFDEHGIFPMNVVRVGDAVHAFTCGWSRRISVPVETAIGRAVSHDDGRTFTRLGPGPIMGATPNESFLVGDPYVAVRDDVWHMWYIYGTEWRESPADPGPARVYKIAYASSADGIVWRRNGVPIIADALGPDECQALPTVFEHDQAWHMYFCYRQSTDFRSNPRRAYRLGYARSTDGLTWYRDDRAGGIDVSDTGWDSEMLCYPHVFRSEGHLYMLYNGNAFGRDGFGAAILEA
jgi:hypothetical protein